MTENIDISKAKSLVQTKQFVNVDKMHSLKKVSEEIQRVIDVVDTYKRKVETLSPPVVNGEPWYKFAFGKASVTEVNKALESFSKFVQETFKLVATCQNLQNENDMNICRLVGLLAIAEGNSYEKLNDIASEIKDLSTEDEESSKQLKELEKSFLQSLDDSALDSSKKEEQMTRLIDYVTLFAESKTKKIRSISLTLSDVKEKLDKYSNIQDSWIEETNSIITSWQKEISNSLDETCKQLEVTIIDLSSKKNSQLDESFEKLRNELVAKMKEQDEKLSQEMERQNARINDSLAVIDNKIANYQTLIDDQNRAISNQNDSINNFHEKQKKEIDDKMADQDKKLSQEIDHQNTNISDFQTAIEYKLAECKTAIETQAKAISEQNDTISIIREELRKDMDGRLAKQDEKLSQEIDCQNTKINDFQTAIGNKLAECKTTIEKQADTISSQNDSINKLNGTIASLKRKIYLALGIGTIAVISIIGTVLFMVTTGN